MPDPMRKSESVVRKIIADSSLRITDEMFRKAVFEESVHFIRTHVAEYSRGFYQLEQFCGLDATTAGDSNCESVH